MPTVGRGNTANQSTSTGRDGSPLECTATAAAPAGEDSCHAAVEFRRELSAPGAQADGGFHVTDFVSRRSHYEPVHPARSRHRDFT